MGKRIGAWRGNDKPDGWRDGNNKYQEMRSCFMAEKALEGKVAKWH